MINLLYPAKDQKFGEFLKIHVEFMATLRRQKNQPREFDLELEEGVTVRDVMKQYFNSEEMKMIQVIIDGLRVNLDQPLQQSDRLFVTIPIGGG
ncbi:MAG: MoaD/ThiS family protein [Candidatus Hodarchaeales archaeon]